MGSLSVMRMPSCFVQRYTTNFAIDAKAEASD
jgi:hypothetical protein